MGVHMEQNIFGDKKQHLIDRGILEYYMRRVFGNDLKIKAQIRGEGEFIDADLGAFLSCVPDYDIDMETFVSELKHRREIKMKGTKKVNYTTGENIRITDPLEEE